MTLGPARAPYVVALVAVAAAAIASASRRPVSETHAVAERHLEQRAEEKREAATATSSTRTAAVVRERLTVRRPDGTTLVRERESSTAAAALVTSSSSTAAAATSSSAAERVELHTVEPPPPPSWRVSLGVELLDLHTPAVVARVERRVVQLGPADLSLYVAARARGVPSSPAVELSGGALLSLSW